MEETRRAFLEDLLTTASPSGFEGDVQRRWVSYVEEFADEVRTDAYGNAVAVHEGGEPAIAVGGHADEIGLMVRDVTDDGALALTRVGGSDRTVMRGQHVTVHAEEPVHGVIGQTAIHLREDDDEPDEINDLAVDVGVDDEEAARELVDVGDPVTLATTVEELAGSRIAGRGMDNRIGIWAAAEALRRARERGTDATVYAVATVQEEIGLRGARMVGYDLAPDAYVAVDVTHATDHHGAPSNRGSGIELGEGPVVARGSTNHPGLVAATRRVADAADVAVQLQAAGSYTGTDADAVYTARGGIPSLNVGVPNRYMHTPVEVIDTEDLEAVADLLGALAAEGDGIDLSGPV